MRSKQHHYLYFGDCPWFFSYFLTLFPSIFFRLFRDSSRKDTFSRQTPSLLFWSWNWINSYNKLLAYIRSLFRQYICTYVLHYFKSTFLRTFHCIKRKVMLWKSIFIAKNLFALKKEVSFTELLHPCSYSDTLRWEPNECIVANLNARLETLRK